MELSGFITYLLLPSIQSFDLSWRLVHTGANQQSHTHLRTACRPPRTGWWRPTRAWGHCSRRTRCWQAPPRSARPPPCWTGPRRWRCAWRPPTAPAPAPTRRWSCAWRQRRGRAWAQTSRLLSDSDEKERLFVLFFFHKAHKTSETTDSYSAVVGLNILECTGNCTHTHRHIGAWHRLACQNPSSSSPS